MILSFPHGSSVNPVIILRFIHWITIYVILEGSEEDDILAALECLENGKSTHSLPSHL